MKKLLSIALLSFVAFFGACSPDSDSSAASMSVVDEISFSELKGTWMLKEAFLDGEQVDSYYRVVFDDYSYPAAIYKIKVGEGEVNDVAKVTLQGGHIFLQWTGTGEVDDLEVLEFGPKLLKYRSQDKKDGVLVETYYRN